MKPRNRASAALPRWALRVRLETHVDLARRRARSMTEAGRGPHDALQNGFYNRLESHLTPAMRHLLSSFEAPRPIVLCDSPQAGFHENLVIWCRRHRDPLCGQTAGGRPSRYCARARSGLADIRQYGLVLEEIVRGGRSTIPANTTERLSPDDQYDVDLIIVRRDQLASVMPELTANRRIPQFCSC